MIREGEKERMRDRWRKIKEREREGSNLKGADWTHTLFHLPLISPLLSLSLSFSLSHLIHFFSHFSQFGFFAHSFLSPSDHHFSIIIVIIIIFFPSFQTSPLILFSSSPILSFSSILSLISRERKD